jgi:formate hydrogenlyase subunit 3/multisubunit Na+/H+ antiporter MnhD subunit
MNWERGIKRVVFVVSFIVFISGYCFAQYCYKLKTPATESYTWYEHFIMSLLIGGFFLAVVWEVYFVVRWIIRGLRVENK